MLHGTIFFRVLHKARFRDFVPCWLRAARRPSWHRRERLWPCPPAIRWRGSRPQRLSSARLASMRSSARAAAQAGCVWCRRWLGQGSCPRPAARCCRSNAPRHDRPCARCGGSACAARSGGPRVRCGRSVGQAPCGLRESLRSRPSTLRKLPARLCRRSFGLPTARAPAHNLPG